MFPQPEDPKGDPQKWSEEEMRLWLNNVSWIYLSTSPAYESGSDELPKRNLQSTGKETREELLARIAANVRAPRV